MGPLRDDATHGDDLLQFVEQVAASFERMGLFRMAGRVIGWLLVCDPPEQTFAQLVDVLQASKASISGAMRFLVSSRWVERFSKPGDRRSYYRLRTDAMTENARRQVEMYGDFAQLMQSGLRALGDQKPQRRARLEEMHAMYAFLDRELPIVWDHWERQRGASASEPAGGEAG